MNTRTLISTTLAALLVAGVMSSGPAGPAAAAVDGPWTDTSLSPDERADLLVAELTLEEKVTLLIQSGGPGLPEYGVPGIRGKDGCCGVATTDTESTALPVGIALASTFDLEAANAYGAVAGSEARHFGFNGIAGPTMDLLTTPLNGRMWEAFGEDPLVSGSVAAAQTSGEQSEQVYAIVKHYNLNNQETRRGHVDAVVDARTLQEVYTRPWEKVVDAGAGSVMCAFNRVNGEYACGNELLLDDILKDQLGFAGYVSSDFNAAHSFADYEAGLDVAGPDVQFSGDNLVQAVQDGVVSEERVTDAARRVLRTFFAFGIIDNPPPGSSQYPQPASQPLDQAMIDEHSAVARSVGDRSAVLLANDGALPLDASDGSIAVIGADADHYIDGGGSGAIQYPAQLTTILDGITARAENDVTYARGTDPVSLAGTLPGPIPVPSSVLRPSSGEDAQGLSGFYFLGTGFPGQPALIRTDPQVDYRSGISEDTINTSQVPSPGVQFATQPISVVWSGTLTAPTTGTYELSLSHLGRAKLLLDRQPLIDDPGTTYGTRSVTIDLVEGQEYFVEVSYETNAPNQFNGGLNDQPGAMIRFGWTPPEGVIADPTIEEAVAAAAAADTAVVVARDYTGEAADRGTLTLPENQDALIEAVAAVNDNTVVVLATSGPVSMPWLDDVEAVLEVWYPGQTQGESVAGVLFGDVTPSGKLPVTFPVDDAQLQAVGIQMPFEQVTEVDPTTVYSDGIYVGYKAYLERGAAPLFPFGHGLSYTSFEYGDAVTAAPVDAQGTDPVATTATVTVTNTGDVAGTEVVQAYVGNLPTDAVETPDLALAGFTRVTLEPGESAEVPVPIDRRSLQYWDVDADEWATPTGTVPLFVGSSSADLRATGELVVAADTTPPTVSITAEPATPNGTQGWYTTPVTLTFAATDDQDPAPVVEVSVDGGEFAVQDGPLVLENDGVHTVVARATDTAGNVSEPTTTEVKVDRTAPETDVDRAGWFLVLISATDEVSGLASIQYRYRVDLGRRTVTTSWADTGGGFVIDVPSPRIVLQYRAVDNAGNVSGVRSVR